MGSAQRVVEWHPRILERLHPTDPAQQWLRALVDAGVILAFDEQPRWEAARRVRRAVLAMEAAEEAVVRARRPVGWSTGGVHPAVALLFVVPLVGLSFVMPALWAIAVVGGASAAVALAGLGWVARERRRLRRDEREAQAAREKAAVEARTALEALFAEAFCARSGPVVVRCWGWRPGERPVEPPLTPEA